MECCCSPFSKANAEALHKKQDFRGFCYTEDPGFRAVPATFSLQSSHKARGSASLLEWSLSMGNCLGKGFAQKVVQPHDTQLSSFGLYQMETSWDSFTLPWFTEDQTVAAGLRGKGRKIYLKPHFLVLGLVCYCFPRPQPLDQHSLFTHTFLAFLELLSFISIILKCLPAFGVLSWLCFPKHLRRTSVPAVTWKDGVTP